MKKICFSILFLGIFPLLSSESREDIKSNLTSSGEKQILAIRNLKSSGFHDLLPIVSKELKSNSSSETLVAEILSLYEAYGDELETYLPDYLEDYEWIMSHSQEDKMLELLTTSMKNRKDRKFIFAVGELITHRNSDVRTSAFQYFSVVKDDRILPYILELGNSEQAIYRFYYLESLRYINDERALIHIPKLLVDPSPAIRMESIAVIDRLKIKEKFQTVLVMARNDSNYEVRKSATIFAKNQSQGRMDIFQGGLRDTHAEVRETSIDSISLFKNPAYSQSVSKAIVTEPLSELKLKMMNCLVTMKSSGGGEGLISAVKNDSNEEVRKEAARITGVLSAREVLPTLISILPKESSINVKKEITRTLGVLKEKSAIPALLSALKKRNEDKSLKQEMLSSLDRINDPKVMPVIFDILNDEPTDFKENIKEFLRNMLYRHHGGEAIKS
ncbi:MAG: HEAT repeat domain-containing protein [Leptospiraceae bacterium]|nr:HEAT repeat domain-containing protein [Leptospiraceae bacterium]